ncbi:MAG: class I SAM-dependent RNA methyltransferase [Ruminococcaceae bacterium]|nr:class I SAM-dependent RNA methyltransferase [Oscillospiraceae bacterium]
MKRLLLTIPTLLGTEQIVANEVRHLGYDTKEVKDGSVTFEGDAEAICLANINLRSAERIMIKLAEFRATSFDELFEKVKKINWESIIEKNAAFPVKGHSVKSVLHSVPDCQSIIKKAIVTRLSNHYGIERFEETGPLYPIQFALMKDVATIYIDTTGENLYKRGYREKSVLAPMRETLAYSMIDLSFWRGDRMFIDPFCGSGTLPIEAALYATNTAPGIRRRFVAETWRNHIPKEMWADAREEARENANPSAKTEIFASDIDPEAIAIAKKNAENAGVADKIRFSVCDVAKLTPSKEKGVIICNPPYGERLLDAKQCERLYRTMGRKFAEFPGMKKFILTSHEQFEQFYGSFADKRRKVYNGMLKCYIYQYFK